MINEKWKEYVIDKISLEHYHQEFTTICILMDQSNFLSFYLRTNEYLDEISDLLHSHDQLAFDLLATLTKELLMSDFNSHIEGINQRIYRLFELILLDHDEQLNEKILDWILEYYEAIERELSIDFTELIYEYFNDPVYLPTKRYLAKQEINKGSHVSKWYQRYILLK